MEVFSGIEQAILRLQTANPDADFTEALSALKNAEVVLKNFNGSENDNEVIGWNLERARALSRDTATVAVKTRFVERGKAFPLSKEIRRLVLVRADDVLRAEGHGMARAFLLGAISEMRRANGSTREAEYRLRRLVELNQAPIISIAEMVPLTAPIAASAAMHARE